MLKEFRFWLADKIAPAPVERETVIEKVRYRVIDANKDIEHHRLNQEQYAALEKSVLVGLVPKTSEEALVMTGVEHVLRKLRSGWVVGS